MFHPVRNLDAARPAPNPQQPIPAVSSPLSPFGFIFARRKTFYENQFASNMTKATADGTTSNDNTPGDTNENFDWTDDD